MGTKANATGDTKVKLRELEKEHVQRAKRGYRYMVESRIGGKRQRKFFKHGEKSAAEAHQTKLEKSIGKVSETHAKLINESLMTEAATAQENLKPYGKTITKAVSFYIEHLEKEARRDKTPIEDVAEMATKIMQGKGGSKDHIKQSRSKWTKLSDHFTNAAFSSLKLKDLKDWIEGFGFSSSTTRANYRTALHTLYSAAIEEGIVEKNLAAKLPNYKRKSCNEVLSPSEVASILTECDDEILPAIAICFFCGIRPDYEGGEISRLDWGSVKLAKRKITLRSGETKTEEFRSVTIPDNLAAWLAPFAKSAGPVVGSKGRFRRLWEEARKKGLKRAWPYDATRNSFASYHMELYDDEFKTATQTGHSSVKTLRDHYKDLVDKEDAEAYFDIFPANDSDIIPIAKQA